MQPPDSLGQAGREAYAEALATLAELGRNAELSRGAILRYCRACDDVQTLRDKWDDLDRPATSIGSMGQIARHPLVTDIREAEAHAANLAARIALDEESRASVSRKLGHPPGVGQAEDRRPAALRRVR